MFSNEEYSFLNTLVLRTPFYSVDAYAADQLPAILAQQIFRNALLLASPDLYRSIAKKGFDYDQLQDKERLTLFKYYNRMSFRPTPFGAFASVSPAGWSADSQIRLGPPGSVILHLLPSLEAGILAQANASGGKTMLTANPTLYRFGMTWRYIRSSTTLSGKLEFALQAIAAAPLYDHLFSLTGGKAVSQAGLTGKIMNFTGCSSPEAANYTAFLIKEQLLLTDQVPGLIEPADLKAAISIGTDQQVPEQALSAAPEAGRRRSFAPYYTGMQRELSGGVDVRVQGQLRDALNMLARIVPQGRLRTLENFKKEFKSRFDREKVPLLTALDPDAGVSYGNLHLKGTEEFMLDGLQFPVDDKNEEAVDWTAVNRLFLRIWLQDSRRGTNDPVNIRDEDLSALPAETLTGSLPPSLAVLFTRSGDQLLIENAGGATAIALIGRFSVFNEAACLLAREIAAAERTANPDVVFAEIHQRSNNHVDNINRRIQIYDHIIPLNVFPYAHENGHIWPNDLLVSVRGEQVILESLSLGRRVIPRLPTAYNFQHNELSVFRFLCDLQYQDLQSNLTFEPERLFPGLAFYPRFCYKNCIISLAKWHFSKADLVHLLSKPFSLGRLHLFRQDHGIPRHISLTQGDQQLVFDLADDREAVFFLENIRDLHAVVIREYLFPDTALTAGTKLRHAGQYIALLKKEKTVYQGSKTEDLPGKETEREFMPGSQWLYISLYCTARSADRILLDLVSPVLEQCGPSPCNWFFIRYHEPRPHLRIRIKTAPGHIGQLLSAFEARLSGEDLNGLVSDFKNETYCRELERYSPALIGRVEDLFCAGTSVYLELITSVKLKQDQELMPFVVVYAMVTRFFASRPDVTAYLQWIKEEFLKEFKADKAFRRELDNKYRELSGGLARLLSLDAGHHHPATASLPGFLSKTGELGRISANWTAARQGELLSDLVHMEVNRMFASAQRQNEAVTYYCLHKYELSRIAKEKAVHGPTAGD